MTTPEFILALREKIGTSPLWLSGVTAVVVRSGEASGDGPPADVELLCVRRADNGTWSPVTGIIDPGEEPADAAIREVREESDIVAVAERLAMIHVLPEMTYENGDRTQYLDIVFRLRWVSGDPYPADGENTEARWFPRDALPEMSDDMLARIGVALSDERETRFVVTPG